MKKTVWVSLMLGLFLSACGSQENQEVVGVTPDVEAVPPELTDSLNVYNWSDYVDDETLREFEDKYQVKIRYDFYDSNETLEAKVLTGKSGYDIVGPGSANIGRQIIAGAYLPLDKSQIPNYENLDPDVLTLLDAVDPGNQYVVPYFVGTNIIGINRTKVEELLGGALPENEWDLVFNPEYTQKLKSCGISYLDSPSEVFPLALHYLGLNPASENLDDLRHAADLMKKVRPDIKRFSSSGYINDLARGDLCVVIGYNGDINIAVKRAKEVGSPFVIEALVPSTGMGIWIDSLAIPKDAKNIINAYRYISHTLDPKIAAQNGTFVTYQPGSKPAKALMDHELTQDRSIFPNKEDFEKSFVIRPFSPDGIKLSVRLWQNIKAGA